MYDTIIIGAGMSGLAAGIRLAYYDQQVCILERHSTIGGLNSFYRLDGRNYDVGLHAVTNFQPKGTKRGPLALLLRQLRIAWEELALSPQVGSSIAFPGVTLKFANGLELLTEEVRRAFPKQIDNFRSFLGAVVEYDDLETQGFGHSARERVGQFITDPLLVEMLFCPLMFYGNAREHDMDFGQFCIMFRSIFFEGLARPLAGVRLILKNLVRRFKALGGELRLRAGVTRLAVDGARVSGVVLDDGNVVEGRRVLSSAGWLETMKLCEDTSVADPERAGRLSFVESVSVLDQTPRELGHDRTIVFYNDSPVFHWERPDELCDVRSGVICSPNNFLYDQPLAEGMLRVTSLANYDRWNELPEDQYRLEKLRWYDRIATSAVRFMPDFRNHVIATDVFTPTTIRRFTGHDNGAVYGAPEKTYDGVTHLKNLFLCGTDQGYVGIVGALVSGITMANRHLLRDPA
jgi:phytoene dehydrogenase-like protein